MALNFISSKDSKYSKDFDETTIIYLKRDNIEIMMGRETHEIIEERFESFLQRYEENLEESKKGSDLIIDSVDALCYDLIKISLNSDKSYIDSPELLKNKKATINPKNNDDKCFQYALTVALNYEKLKKNPERISKIKLFIDRCNWKEISFPSHKKD